MNVLFVCTQNVGRSQMAAALLNKTCSEFFEARSAGLEAGTLNPLAVEALGEIEIDISKNKTQTVFDVFKSGRARHFTLRVDLCEPPRSRCLAVLP